MDLAKERRASIGHSHTLPRAGSGHSSRVSGGNLPRLFFLQFLKMHGTESSSPYSVAVSLLSEAVMLQSKVLCVTPYICSIQRAVRAVSLACAAAHRETRGSGRVAGQSSCHWQYPCQNPNFLTPFPVPFPWDPIFV